MEEKKMPRSLFLTLVIVFYLFLYIVFKFIIVFTQDLYMDNEIYEKEYSIGKVLKINLYSESERASTDYFSNTSSSYHFKVKNYFDGFEAGDMDSNYEYYLRYDDENKVEAAFMMGQFNTQMYNIYNYDESSYYSEFNHFPLYISNMLRDSFIKKHNIHNDLDLIRYIRERKKIDCNFFTPILTIKENYFFNFVETALPELDNVTYIEGDIEGYMYETASFKQVCILRGDKIYCLTFYKLDYFTDDMITDIIRSVVIE